MMWLVALMGALSLLPAWSAGDDCGPRGTGFHSCRERQAYAKSRVKDFSMMATVAWAEPFDYNLDCSRYAAMRRDMPVALPELGNDCHPAPFALPAGNAVDVHLAMVCHWREILHGWPSSSGDANFGAKYPPLEKRLRILAAARKAAERIQFWGFRDSAQVHDLAEVNHVPMEMTRSQLREAARAFEDHVRQAAMAGSNVDPSTILDPFQRRESVFERALGLDRSPEPSPEQVFRRLDTAMSGMGGGLTSGGASLSPYEARMIMTFYLQNEIRRTHSSADYTRIMDEFARKLRLKVVTGPEVQNAEQVTWANTIPHGGYVYGATAEQALPVLSTDDNAVSVGIDCSSLVQQALAVGGVSDPRVRNVRDRMYVGGLHRAPIEGMRPPARVCREDQLVPGDVIYYDEGSLRHTYVFAGYSENPPYNPLILDAEGEGHRDAALREIDFYRGKDNCSGYSWLKNRHSYVLRPAN